MAATATVGPLRLECNDDDFRRNLVYTHVADKQNEVEGMSQLELLEQNLMIFMAAELERDERKRGSNGGSGGGGGGDGDGATRIGAPSLISDTCDGAFPCKVPDDDPRIGLRGQWVLVAAHDLAMGHVVAEVNGRRFLASEWERLNWTCQEDKGWIYLLPFAPSLSIFPPLPVVDFPIVALTPPHSATDKHSCYAYWVESSQEMYNGEAHVIDFLSGGYGRLVNDYRRQGVPEDEAAQFKVGNHSKKMI